MNLKDLKYLVALAEHHHFGKAAESCFVSQPALSMQIKKLEEYLGVLLIERMNNKFIFTQVGEIIVGEARNILLRVDVLKELAHQAKDPFEGVLRIGIIPTLAPYLLPCIALKLNALYPKVIIHWVEGMTEDLINKLDQGLLDCALLATSPDENFIIQSLFDEAFFLAVSLNHPFATRNAVKLSDLKNQTLLLLDDGHCLREQTLAVCYKAQASESTSYRATSLETLRYMVAAGAGVTLMPKLSCLQNTSIQYLAFSSPAPARTISMVWRKSTAKTILLQHMVEQIKNLTPL